MLHLRFQWLHPPWCRRGVWSGCLCCWLQTSRRGTEMARWPRPLPRLHSPHSHSPGGRDRATKSSFNVYLFYFPRSNINCFLCLWGIFSFTSLLQIQQSILMLNELCHVSCTRKHSVWPPQDMFQLTACSLSVLYLYLRVRILYHSGLWLQTAWQRIWWHGIDKQSSDVISLCRIKETESPWYHSNCKLSYIVVLLI